MKPYKTKREELREEQAIRKLQRMSLHSLDSIVSLRKKKIAQILLEKRNETFNTSITNPSQIRADIFCCQETHKAEKERSFTANNLEIAELLHYYTNLEERLTRAHQLTKDSGMKVVTVIKTMSVFLEPEAVANSDRISQLSRRLRGPTASPANNSSVPQDLLLDWLNTNMDYLRISSMRALWTLFIAKVPNCRVSYFFFREFLMQSFGFKFTKIAIKSSRLTTQESTEQRLILFRKIKSVLDRGYKLVFLDESYFRRVHNRVRNWTSSIFNLNEAEYGDVLRDTATLTLAVTPEGFKFHRFLRQSNTEDTFIEFVEDLVAKLKENGIERFYLFLDNVHLHKTNKVLSYLREQRINAIFSVKYVCEFNLCEYAFSNLKTRHYRRISKSQSDSNLALR